jgi:S-disulfanyl-L-cysteine oxidoreductase SoxD
MPATNAPSTMVSAGTSMASGRSSVPQPATEPQTTQRLGIGRVATPQEVSGWDIAIRPDGHGLPHGKGTVKAGEALYMERCAACHGEFGEAPAVGRF